MEKVTLYIETPGGEQTASLDQELTIGRTPPSDLVLADSGLSRKNTTIFRDGEDVLIVDEDSLNGTFLNDEPVTGPPHILRDGDRISIGSDTLIRVSIGEHKSENAAGAVEQKAAAAASTASSVPAAQSSPAAALTSSHDPSHTSNKLLIAAGVMTLLILFAGLLGIFIASRSDVSAGNNNPGGTPPQIIRAGLIPMRVIDPLGGENEDDLDDLIASWETEEKELDANTVADVAVGSDTADADLNVTAAFLADRQAKSLEPRNAETGIRPAGLNVPKQLFGDGVIKQKTKLAQMNATGYKQPMDFADLADKRLKKDLIEMPMAGNSYYLAVGGSATENAFTSFSFQSGNAEIAQGSPKYQILSQLAGNFSGQKYDLNNGADRKQMRMRLLRMFNQRAKPILLEVADAYYKKYNRPLRVTSLTRSMDYQIGLNATNANSFKVRGEGSLPPHTSGCAFDLARKHMTAEEQNFVMNKLAEMEDAGKLDALIEYGVNACFHIFIYADGIAPKM